jgi:ABC-2 type transport system ATP-binding protein
MGALKHLVNRKFKTVEAVKGVSFSIAPGEVVGFLGANGAGKTTTLKVLTGLVRPTAGQVHVYGFVPFERRPEFLHAITLVMGQKQQLVWDLPAIDSLAVNAAVYDLPRSVAAERISELSQMLGIDEQLRKPVRKLSLGERMKCELLAALLHRPRVLLLDEPTLGLDVNAQAALRRFLIDYNQRYQATLLLTSHYMADIVALCPRVLLIHEGRLIYDGSLAGLIDRFAPHREVRLELQEPLERAALESFGSVEAIDGLKVTLLVERSQLTETVARLLAQVRPRDLSVGDPPVERIVGRLFIEGIGATPGAHTAA